MKQDTPYLHVIAVSMASDRPHFVEPRSRIWIWMRSPTWFQWPLIGHTSLSLIDDGRGMDAFRRFQWPLFGHTSLSRAHENPDVLGPAVLVSMASDRPHFVEPRLDPAGDRRPAAPFQWPLIGHTSLSLGGK